MPEDNTETLNEAPIINNRATNGLTDYYCPFCNQKLFRGKVATFNMVCSNCNKLVKSEQDYLTKGE